MNSYTQEVTRLLDTHKNVINAKFAEAIPVEDIKRYAKNHIINLPFDDEKTVEETYLMRTHMSDAIIIQDYVEKMITVTQHMERGNLFYRTAVEIQQTVSHDARNEATARIRSLAEEMSIDFFDTLSLYDYATYDNYENLDMWAREAVFESSWENVFGELESIRYMNGAYNE